VKENNELKKTKKERRKFHIKEFKVENPVE
jgi:hypothetical protein